MRRFAGLRKGDTIFIGGRKDGATKVGNAVVAEGACDVTRCPRTRLTGRILRLGFRAPCGYFYSVPELKRMLARPRDHFHEGKIPNYVHMAEQLIVEDGPLFDVEPEEVA